MTTERKSNDSYDLFMGALDVINDALNKLRDKPLIKNIINLMDEQAEGRKFGVAVYDTDVDSPHDYFTIRMHNESLQLASHGKDAPDIDWKVSMEFLRDINENPQKYIDDPWKLDIEWLKDRLQSAA
tara:strand:+ start:962 stop:1342 length:381 start_codon:yes stop_codon:yes gene_type:complete